MSFGDDVDRIVGHPDRGLIVDRVRGHRHAGNPDLAVGIQSALHSAIGLPSSSSSASWMLAFLIPADVRRSFVEPILQTMAPCRAKRSQAYRPEDRKPGGGMLLLTCANAVVRPIYERCRCASRGRISDCCVFSKAGCGIPPAACPATRPAAAGPSART